MSAVAFSAAKIKVGDIDGLERFYSAALGFTVTARIEDGEGPSHIREIFLGLPGGGAAQFALIKFVNLPLPEPGEAIIALTVTDLETAIASVLAHGGSDLTGPVDVPSHNLRIAIVADPEGHQIELISQTAA